LLRVFTFPSIVFFYFFDPFWGCSSLVQGVSVFPTGHVFPHCDSPGSWVNKFFRLPSPLCVLLVSFLERLLESFFLHLQLFFLFSGFGRSEPAYVPRFMLLVIYVNSSHSIVSPTIALFFYQGSFSVRCFSRPAPFLPPSFLVLSSYPSPPRKTGRGLPQNAVF